MIIFKLLSLNFMAGDINWKEKTLTIPYNIKYLYIKIDYYKELYYISNCSLNIFYNWNKFLSYWNDTLLEYSKAFNIDFNKLVLNIDYSIAPLYINNDIIVVGIYLINYTPELKESKDTLFIPSIKSKLQIQTFNFLSSVESNTIESNNHNHNNKNINKYNCFYSILNRHDSNDYLKKQCITLELSLNTISDIKTKTKIKIIQKLSIPLKYILQNSMNYLPKLKIIITKKISQNLLNP
jgi:hypothetical protein